jgi:hypothetical protein
MTTWPHPGRVQHRLEALRLRERIPRPIETAMCDVVSGKRPWPLVLCGGPGVGKTCASLYLADRCRGLARYTTFGALTETVRRAKCGELWDEGSHAETRLYPEDVWERWQRATLAVLDELGVRGDPSEFAREVLTEAIDRRFCRPLVVASNLDLDRLAGLYDDRVASRLAAGTVVNLYNVPDQRQRQMEFPA